MKAITTKFMSVTNTKGARIKAMDEDGNSLMIGYSYEYRGERAHWEAAKAMCEKMGWHRELIAGGIKGGYVFVFTINAERYLVPRTDNRRGAQ